MIKAQSIARVAPMTHRAAVLIALAASLLLAGCFFSETPKFLPGTAVAVFGEGGRYQAYERLEDGSYKTDEVVVIKRRADRSYDFVDEKGDTNLISFHAIAGGYHVGQARSEKNKPAYAYLMIRMSGNEAQLYIPQCDRQEKSLLLRYAVTLTREFECLIDRVVSPEEFFASVKLGEPTSKLVPQ
jgi:hypothetical protein